MNWPEAIVYCVVSLSGLGVLVAVLYFANREED